uniref:Phosphatidylserine synthase n=1 Tax=Amphimedon queenslandica TaxID=400682 RepID=A0A1X7V5L5_AMPQE
MPLTMLTTSIGSPSATIALAVVFLVVSVCVLYHGAVSGVVSAMWRVVLALLIVYIGLLLVFILFQTPDDARYFLTFYDSSLGVSLPERTYAEDCRIYTPDHPDGMFAHFMDKMDIFVTSHLVGWFAKALIVRDVWLLNIVSIAFELLEYTLECQLPNFGECWWDHWILDFAVCNGLGIYFGMLACRYFNLEWLLQELNGFYLKTILWIPPNHSINIMRQCLYAFCGAAAIKEIYHFLQSNKTSSIGSNHFSWLVFTALIVETLIVI